MPATWANTCEKIRHKPSLSQRTHVSHEALAAELSPGIVATIPELQQAGFHYAA
jgi:hypothetical protein